MHHFTAHRLMIRTTVAEPLLLNEHKGSALRGALYHALRNRFCTMLAEGHACSECPLWGPCPVCRLVSTLDPDNRLGRDTARPYTIQPPLDAGTLYRPGEPFAFGLTLYAETMQLFPYVVMALRALEEEGLGLRLESNHWRRGTLRIEEVWAENPLTGERADVTHQGERIVRIPALPITHEQVCAAAGAAQRELGAQQELGAVPLHCEFLTPTRLTSRGQLVKPADLTFAVLLGRLLDRLESLASEFCDTPLQVDFAALIAAAQQVRVLANETRWVELRSYSTRQQRATPIGGLVGRVTFAADDWRPYLPWLIWGQFTHVGKDAVKGNGWYRIHE